MKYNFGFIVWIFRWFLAIVLKICLGYTMCDLEKLNHAFWQCGVENIISESSVEGRTGEGAAQADVPVTDEFGCRVVYIDYTRDMTKSV